MIQRVLFIQIIPVNGCQPFCVVHGITMILKTHGFKVDMTHSVLGLVYEAHYRMYMSWQ